MAEIISSDDPVEFTVRSVADSDLVFKPPYVEDINAEATSNDETLVDGCGNQENRSINSGAWQLDVTGLILKPHLAVLKEIKGNGDVTITNDIETSTYSLDSISITQSDEPVKARFPNHEPSRAALARADQRQDALEGRVFEFMLQTKDPSQSGDGEGV